jgi:hypothetical protein
MSPLLTYCATQTPNGWCVYYRSLVTMKCLRCWGNHPLYLAMVMN